MKSRSAPHLDDFDFFSGLSASSRQYLQRRLKRYVFTPGQEILRQGQRSNIMAIICEGQVKLVSAKGDTMILTAGQTFGQGMLRFGTPSSFTATAQKNTILWTIRRSDWLTAKQLPSKSNTASSASHGFRFWGMVTLVFLAIALIALGPFLLDWTMNRLTRYAIDAGRLDLAEQAMQLYVQWSPDSAQALDKWGYLLALQGNSNEAVPAFERAVSLDEMYASARNNLGVALLYQARSDLAIDQLKKAVELDPGNATSFLNLGNAYLSAADLKNAEDAYRRAFELDPNQVEAKALWAGIVLRDGRIAQAREAWEQVLLSSPGHMLAHQGLGAIAVLEGNPSRALTYLEAAKIADPQDALTRLYLGMALEELGRTVEAAAEFERALELSNDPAITSLAENHLDAIQPENRAGE